MGGGASWLGVSCLARVLALSQCEAAAGCTHLFEGISVWGTLSAQSVRESPRQANGAFMSEPRCAGAMFKEAGFEPDMKVMASSSKTLSFRKPLASSSPAPSNGHPAAESSSPAPSTSSPAEESYDDITAAEHSAAEMGTVPAS